MEYTSKLFFVFLDVDIRWKRYWIIRPIVQDSEEDHIVKNLTKEINMSGTQDKRFELTEAFNFAGKSQK